jgi:hypothetical protein
VAIPAPQSPAELCRASEGRLRFRAVRICDQRWAVKRSLRRKGGCWGRNTGPREGQGRRVKHGSWRRRAALRGKLRPASRQAAVNRPLNSGPS